MGMAVTSIPAGDTVPSLVPQPYANRDSDCHSHANRDPYSNTYAYPMHGEMYTDPATAPHTATSSLVRALRLTNR